MRPDLGCVRQSRQIASVATLRDSPMVRGNMVPILSVIIAALALIIAILGGVLKYVMNRVKESAITHERLNQIGRDIQKLVADKDKTHAEILEQIKFDRNATNERLTYLERRVWGKG